MYTIRVVKNLTCKYIVTKSDRFYHQNNYAWKNYLHTYIMWIEMVLSLQNLGINLENKVPLYSKLANNVNNKSCLPDLQCNYI